VPPRLVVRHESTGLSLGARDRLRAAVLSGVAGYVDAAGLLSLAALFPAHITGELVSEAVALSSAHRDGSPSRLWMLPVFMLAVAVAAVVARVEKYARPLKPYVSWVHAERWTAPSTCFEASTTRPQRQQLATSPA